MRVDGDPRPGLMVSVAIPAALAQAWAIRLVVSPRAGWCLTPGWEKPHNQLVSDGEHSFLHEWNAGPAPLLTAQQEARLLGWLADWECPRPSRFHRP